MTVVICVYDEWTFENISFEMVKICIWNESSTINNLKELEISVFWNGLSLANIIRYWHGIEWHFIRF